MTHAHTLHSSLLMLFLAGATHGEIPDAFTVIDLGAIGGPSIATSPGSSAQAINDAGVVAGFSVVADEQPDIHAFTWTKNTLTDLTPLPMAQQSAAFVVADDGTAIGVSYNLGMVGVRATRWTPQGSEHLGDFTPQEINASGAIVGTGRSDFWGAHTTGYLWSNGSLTPVLDLGGSDSAAFSINDAGEIVGSATLPNSTSSHACILINGQTHDLATLGGPDSQARDINNARQVVGVADISDTVHHAFLAQVNPDGTVQSTTDLGELSAGSSFAHALNDSAQVVGTSDSRAFIWDAGPMADLNTLIPANSGWILYAATDINNSTWITGYGTYEGLPRAFLLIPRASVCDGDVNGDNTVDVNDISYILFRLGNPGSDGDANNDGAVDVNDIAYILFRLGNPCP